MRATRLRVRAGGHDRPRDVLGRRLFTTQIGWAALVGIPAAVAGALIGDLLAARVAREWFRRLVLLTLALSGALALVSALTR